MQWRCDYEAKNAVILCDNYLMVVLLQPASLWNGYCDGSRVSRAWRSAAYTDSYTGVPVRPTVYKQCQRWFGLCCCRTYKHASCDCSPGAREGGGGGRWFWERWRKRSGDLQWLTMTSVAHTCSHSAWLLSASVASPCRDPRTSGTKARAAIDFLFAVVQKVDAQRFCFRVVISKLPVKHSHYQTLPRRIRLEEMLHGA